MLVFGLRGAKIAFRCPPYLTLYCLACHIYDTFSQNFDFNLRRDHQKKKKKKNSYERRDYESVDEKSLSLIMSRKSTQRRIRAVKG